MMRRRAARRTSEASTANWQHWPVFLRFAGYLLRYGAFKLGRNCRCRGRFSLARPYTRMPAHKSSYTCPAFACTPSSFTHCFGACGRIPVCGHHAALSPVAPADGATSRLALGEGARGAWPERAPTVGRCVPDLPPIASRLHAVCVPENRPARCCPVIRLLHAAQAWRRPGSIM